MPENYKDMESLEEALKLINEGAKATGVSASVALAVVTGCAFFPLDWFMKREIEKRFYEYKLSLYTKALEVQNALILKLKEKVNRAESEIE